VWKEVFLVGTEWDQFGDVDKYDWDFDHLDDAINDGELKEGKLYLFGSTERRCHPLEALCCGDN